MTTTRSYAAGHFELAIDGHAPTAYVKSVDGGWPRGHVIDEPVGGTSNRIKHLSIPEVEPLSVEMGLTGAGDVLAWIQGSWNRQWSRRNGQVTHGSLDLYETFSHEFYDALITEATFPALDASSKEPGYLKFKFLPERVVTKRMGDGEAGSRVTGNIGPQVRQKLWSAAAFRFSIDSIDEMQFVNKVESFTVKQTIKKMYTGADRFPQIEPTGVQFPNLTGTIGLQHAGGLLDWHQDYISHGSKEHPSQKSGRIEFLSPDRKQTIFSINLCQVGILFAGVEPATANADAIKRVKFELYVHRMEMDGPGALGFE